VGGYILTMVGFSLFNPDTFTPGVPLPTGWLLVTLALSAVWSTAAGFVTGVLACRREIEHGVGVAIFLLILSTCFVVWNKNLAQVPTWYVAAGEILTTLAILTGGWLRRHQRVSVARTPDDAPLSIAAKIDRRRFQIAAAATFLTLLACFWALVLGAGQGLLW